MSRRRFGGRMVRMQRLSSTLMVIVAAHLTACSHAGPSSSGSPDSGTPVSRSPSCAVPDAGPGPTSTENAWTQMGPAPESFQGNDSSGRTTALALASATRWYVVSAGGGVWKTDNAGTSWAPLTDDQPILSGSTIAMDPTDPTALWVGTGEADCSIASLYGAGILVSADGGAGWAQVAADLFGRARIAKIAVGPSSSAGSRTLYAAATGCLSVGAERGIDSSVHGGLAKSTDGGRSWSFVPAFPSGSTANDVVVDPSGVVLMSRFALPPEDSSHTGIYRSTNGGSNLPQHTAGLHTYRGTAGRTSA